jgi:type II secretory pathway predicted ATPase ExeA
MYYAYFGLKQPPFRITPDTDFFFEGGNRGAVLEALIYAITHGEGIVKVTGEVGSGKTMLCRVLQSRLPATVETVYLANPSVSADEILHAIGFELQLPIERDATRLEVMHALNEYLLARHAEGRQVVVFVEESQGMPIATLEEIRLLSNLETRQHKLLQIVLFGQPELDANLRKPEIRQLRERITHSFALSPLNAEEVRDYLAFRLRAAGYHGPDLFAPKVIRYIGQTTGGLTRRINIVADKALLAAFAENTHNVSLRHVQAAVRDSEFSDRQAGASWFRRPGWGFAAVVALLALGTGALLHGLLTPGPVQPPAIARAPAPPPAGPSESVAPPLPAGAPHTPPVVAAPPADPAAPSAAVPAAPAPAAAQTTKAAPVAAMPVASATPLASRNLPASSMTAANTERTAADLLEQRLLATDRWLAEEQASVFSIQLLGSTDPELLRRYLRTLSNYIDPASIFVYRTVANREPSMTVLYGAFTARAQAVESLDRLPDELKASRPYIRTVQGIRSELGLAKPSS